MSSGIFMQRNVVEQAVELKYRLSKEGDELYGLEGRHYPAPYSYSEGLS